MKLNKLLQNTKVISTNGDMNISVVEICSDSREVEPGFMFVAVAAISFASCGNKTEQAAPVDSDTVAVVDSAAIDSCCAGDSCCADSAKAE